MIKNKKELNYYIKCDLEAQDISSISFIMRLKALLVPTLWKYEILLRRYEYFYNQPHTVLNSILKSYACIKLKRYEIKVGGYKYPLMFVAQASACAIKEL